MPKHFFFVKTENCCWCIILYIYSSYWQSWWLFDKAFHWSLMRSLIRLFLALKFLSSGFQPNVFKHFFGIFNCYLAAHSALPPLNYGGGDFLVLKKNFKGSWHFLHFRGGGGIWGACQNRLWRGEFNFWKLNCILVLSFSQFSKIV